MTNGLTTLSARNQSISQSVMKDQYITALKEYVLYFLNQACNEYNVPMSQHS
jgi:hypothetical protein